MDASQLLKSINQNISEGIYHSDVDGLIYVNIAFAIMFGYSSEQEVLSANSFRLYKDPDERGRLLERLNLFGSFENINPLEAIQSVLGLNNQTIKKSEIDIGKSMSIRSSSAYLVSIFQKKITNVIKYGTIDRSKKIEILQ